MESQNRFLIAIILSVLVLFVYQKLFVPPADINHITTVSHEETISTDTVESEAYQAMDEQARSIENEYVTLLFGDNTARAKQIYLKKFKDTTTGEPTSLLDPGAINNFLTGPFLVEDLFLKDIAVPKWQMAESAKDSITYILKNQNGITITKEIFFHNSNYGIWLRLKIKNNSPSPVPINYKLIGPSSVFVKKGIDERFLSLDVKAGQDTKRIDPKKILKNNGAVFTENPSWAGIRGRYFSLVIEPKQKEKSCFFEKDGDKGARTGFIIGPTTINPGEEINEEFLLYAGPNSTDEMTKTSPEMADIITYGFWGSISVLLLKMLNFFNGIFHNYGVAIIMLVAVISIILFPLTKKSLQSMKDMQAIQPEIEKLRTEYKDKPQKLNKEIMDLYKRHKINPLGGCLPMLFQFPVFIALYNALIRSVELKGAGFLWIKDLSEPDSTFKLPISLPVIGNSINILPILVIITMFIQQKMSQSKSAQTEQQRLMSLVTVVLIGFLFYSLPSGFELYWLTSTVIVLIIQQFILKTKPTPEHDNA